MCILNSKLKYFNVFIIPYCKFMNINDKQLCICFHVNNVHVYDCTNMVSVRTVDKGTYKYIEHNLT